MHANICHVGLLIIFILTRKSNGDHFRGGTISWSATGSGYEVEFVVKLGWRYTWNPCNGMPLNTYISTAPPLPVEWQCIEGCSSATATVGPPYTGYYCTALSAPQDWEMTEDTFRYNFAHRGPFKIAYTGSAWILEVGGGSWNVHTTIDLNKRSDSDQPNRSPVVTYKPIFYLKYGCVGDIKLHVTDADNDRVSCRWSTGDECASICHSNGDTALATLDETSCTLTINANVKRDQLYALAITIEDRPLRTITVGGKTFTPSDVLSIVPLQFVLQTKDIPSRSCTDKPIFLDPTPDQNEVLVYEMGKSVFLSYYATSPKATINVFTILEAPKGTTQTIGISADEFNRPDVYMTTLFWTPTAADKGLKTVCLEATDTFLMSAQHCVTLAVWDTDPCEKTPCINNATCTREKYTDFYQCSCLPGYTGRNCEIDIDECASGPCQNKGTCFDLVNEYFCGCADGYTGTHCETDVDECEIQPCENGGTCMDMIASSKCVCKQGYTGTICQTGLQVCDSQPCLNDGRCVYNETTGYTCECVDNWLGTNCGFRFENETHFLGNKTNMIHDYMHYSNCDCVIGDRKQEYCYMYTLNKHVGYGFLSFLIGLLTSIGLYILFGIVFNRCFLCFHQRIIPEKEQIEEEDVEKHDEPAETQSKGKTSVEELVKPQPRRHHCWACDVKYNMAPMPVWYRQEVRKYKK